MKILILHVRGLHLGYLGCYGNDWIVTPNLDRLAAEGIVFDRHIADYPHLDEPWSRCFRRRYRLPVPTGGLDASRAAGAAEALAATDPLIVDARATSDFLDTLAGKLEEWPRRQNGVCWVDWPTLAPPWDIPAEFLAPYFPEMEDEEPLTPWLDPPTGPFDDAGSDRERLQNTYAAVVSFFDAQVGIVLDELERSGTVEDVLVCVTASSGLALGEHGYIGPHRAWLHEEIVHVPLLMRLPGAAEAGLRIAALTQPLDLLPTLLAALNLPAIETEGFNLLPLVRGETAEVRKHAVSGLALGDSVEWAVRTPEWAYLLPLSTPAHDPPRSPQLFVKPEDRWEVNEVGQHHPEVMEELEKTLREHEQGQETGGQVEKSGAEK